MKRLFILTVVFVVFVAFVGCDDGTDWGSYGSSDSPGIYGQVTDFATGYPIQYANVQLINTGETTLTGSNGMFKFENLEPREDYQLKVSKVEYEDLLDPNKIVVKDRQVRRDVQIKKNMTEVVKLDILDNDGNPMNELNFGKDPDLISRQFQIYNAGPERIKCEFDTTYSANWVTSVTLKGGYSSVDIDPGRAYAAVATIDRDKLSLGENVTTLQIRTDNGSKELKVVAISESDNNRPVVETLAVTETEDLYIDQVHTFFNANVTTVGNPVYTERGFCFALSNSDLMSDDIWTTKQCESVEGAGVGEIGKYQYEATYDLCLKHNETVYVRAYLKWKEKFVYGNVKSFVVHEHYY